MNREDMERKTVTINGRLYDQISGLPLKDTPAPQATSLSQPIPTRVPTSQPQRSVHAGNIHSQVQRSQTLRRSSLKRPQQIDKSTQTPAPAHTITHHRKPSTTSSVVKDPAITKFAPQLHPQQPKPVQQVTGPRMMDIGPMKHPHVVKAQAQVDAKKTPAEPKPAQVIKQEAIQNAIQNTVRNTTPPKRGFKHPGVASIITASFALLVLGGYLTYLNMPSLSVRVAAAAAGIDASYPTYHPDGYSLKGPVAYDKGQVSIKFGSNAGTQQFTINQAKSSWDSAAVLDNYVTPRAGGDYATYSERGLTIYTFDEGVAWVNGGILYTIEGDARLSSEQIRHIATSFL